MPEARRHRVLMITTGGTIGGNVALPANANPGAAEDPEMIRRRATTEELERVIGPTRADLEKKLNMEVSIDPHEIVNIDSSDVQPSLWVDLATLIHDRYDDYDSFLITHGTNTLGYTCAALSFAIANSGKPIVLTGSQVPMGLPGTDAKTNLENALRVAVWQGNGNESEQAIRGVVAVFGSYIITGTRVKKDTEFDYDAFKSFGGGAIGRIGRIINVNAANLAKHNSYLRTGKYRVARNARELVVDSGFNMKIASLTEFPGMDPELLLTLIKENSIQGVILRAFGAGDPATNLRPAFEQLKRKEIPVVVTTQAPNGNSNFQVNEPGQWLRDNDMAIPAYDMSIESQTAKLGWLLHREGNRRFSYKEICEKMVEDLRGEINVMWEV